MTVSTVEHRSVQPHCFWGGDGLLCVAICEMLGSHNAGVTSSPMSDHRSAFSPDYISITFCAFVRVLIGLFVIR